MSPARIAVVSPFIDKRHGTERRIAEWIARLPADYEIHIYSQRVEDVDLTRMRWHRIPKLPGPHLFNFLWWLAANHLWRWWDARVRGLAPDLVYTAGTNCWDADLVSVHIVFAEFVRMSGHELSFLGNPARFWPRLAHRWLYYRLIMSLERTMYTNPKTRLILIARKTAEDLRRHYGLAGPFPVVYIGLDKEIFNPELRLRNRSAARAQLGLGDDVLALVLVGNDWKKKGLVNLIEALAQLKDLPLVLVVAGKDDAAPYQNRLRELGLDGKVKFCPPRADVQWYYAAADMYVGPSLEDTFAQPPAEAMACGLPVITTATNGTAEIMTDGVDGLVLQDPNDVAGLAQRIRRLYERPEERERMAALAAVTAAEYTWDRNGVEMRAIFADALQRRRQKSDSSPERETAAH
ncbi:MAG TPA: glycosyltransferase family 4 protein [Verrucomicrobiae bacterium]|jgi:glycosyltransferase involved in cell wall biosynthesis|nr:glycosyltransferase family 4 protein [Verrucomicrobiae bacterium]